MRRFILLLFIAIMPLAIACSPIADSAPDTVIEAVAGSEFNKFFPEDQDDYNVIYTQEKEGFAQAQLQFKGVEVATLSISDTANNPSALEKFQQSSTEVAGYPAAAVGELGTAILIADRFQVQIRSKDASFTAADREAWMEQFDLAGLAALK
jgi:hypothetical protein